MSDLIQQTNEETFESTVLKSDVPVLVDYWAEWCGPCKALAPLLEDLAKEYGGKLKIAKVNVDENQQLARKYNIKAIPTLMIFKDGNMQASKLGMMSKPQLTAFLDSNI